MAPYVLGVAYPRLPRFSSSLLIPESPGLIMTRRTAKATKVLHDHRWPKFAQKWNAPQPQPLDSESSRGLSLLSAGSVPWVRFLILGVVIAVFQQWCGTNVIVLNCSSRVFSARIGVLGDLFFQIVVTGITIWYLP